MKIKATNVFERNFTAYQQGKRFIINQGGTRSSKTYSLCQLMISIGLSEPNCKISVIRRTGPALRASVMKDLIGILKDWGLYNQENHQKTEWTYTFDNGSEISFFSADNDLKLRGRAHDIVWINEANELSYDIFSELNQRCRKCIFIDFNPSDLFSYIYDLYKRPEAIMIKSNYLDNPFLPDELVREIEYYKEHDPWRWRVMGLGEIGESPELIFDTFDYYDEEPEGKVAYGADWGFKDPTTIIKATLYDGVKGWELYLREILYETHLTPQEIVKRFTIVDKYTNVYCDHRPEYIEMLSDWFMKPAKKDINAGIMAMKDCKIFLHRASDNMIKEFRNYKWKKQGDKITDTPVDAFNHCFTGDMKITTMRGQVPIKDVIPGVDFALTSKGWKRINKLFDNGEKNVKLYWMKVDTFNIYIKATDNHLIKNKEELWTPISQLKKDMTIYHIKSLMGKYGNYIKEKDILVEDVIDYTDMYGNTTTEKYQKDLKYTILMKIQQIIGLKTLNAYLCWFIKESMVKRGLLKIKNGLKIFTQKVLRLRKSGTRVKRVENGTLNMVKKLGKEENMKLEYAKFVPKNTERDTQELVNIAIKTARLRHCEPVEESKERVYDIEVDGEHEYFVNGILVHNSIDAARYALMGLKGGGVSDWNLLF